MVDVLATPDGLVPGLRVPTEQTPLTYCLPVLCEARVVVSAGTMDRLSPDELDAVLAHEQAHLRALTRTGTLVELLADDGPDSRPAPHYWPGPCSPWPARPRRTPASPPHGRPPYCGSAA